MKGSNIFLMVANICLIVASGLLEWKTLLTIAPVVYILIGIYFLLAERLPK